MAPKKKLTLQTIHDPRDHNKPTTLDLVLVHGLNGDPVQTWTHQETKVFWPKDLLPRKQPETRILSFGYNADIYNNTSLAGIRGNARALLARLQDQRDASDGVDPRRPIVFLAHSLGGLIVKQLLRFANNEPAYSSIASATGGFLFYGTPHAGAEASRWLSLSKRLSAIVPKGHAAAPLVEALTCNSRDITELCEDFRHLTRRYAVFSFYETLPWPGTAEPVVDKLSALMNLDHEDQIPLDVDHATLCRFEDQADDGFQATEKRIRRAAKGFNGGADAGFNRVRQQPEVVNYYYTNLYGANKGQS